METKINSFTELSPAQQELLQFFRPLDAADIAESLQWLHDNMAYFGDHPIEPEEKAKLYDARRIIDLLRALDKENNDNNN